MAIKDKAPRFLGVALALWGLYLCAVAVWALTGRLRRAVDNHFEALIFFTIAVVVVTLSSAANPLTAACAWVYLAARILYVPAYAFGWSPWRSAIFTVGAAATAVMILAALF